MTNRTISNAQAQLLVGTQGMSQLVKAGQSTTTMNGAVRVVVAIHGGALVYCLEGDREVVNQAIEAVTPRPMMQSAPRRVQARLRL